MLSTLLQESSGTLTHDQACELIALDDELWGGVAGYVQNFEGGIAGNADVRAKFCAVLARVQKTGKVLFRGECRSNWRADFGRGFHSWTPNLKTAHYFKSQCDSRDSARILVLQKPVRLLYLSDIIYHRTVATGELHYPPQDEYFVFDPDAVRLAKEVDDEAAERIYNS